MQDRAAPLRHASRATSPVGRGLDAAGLGSSAKFEYSVGYKKHLPFGRCSGIGIGAGAPYKRFARAQNLGAGGFTPPELKSNRFAGGPEGHQDQNKRTRQGVSFYFGAGSRIRTGDLLITSEMLYQLSHTSKCGLHKIPRCAFYHLLARLSIPSFASSPASALPCKIIQFVFSLCFSLKSRVSSPRLGGLCETFVNLTTENSFHRRGISRHFRHFPPPRRCHCLRL